MVTRDLSKIVRGMLTALALVCSLWAAPAQAVPDLSYSFSGYTNTIALDDGSVNAPYLGYGNYVLGLFYNPALATAATSSYVDGLKGVLSFAQDPNVYNGPDPNIPSGPAINGVDFNLPGGATSFVGTFTELFALSYANSFLSLDFMDPNLQSALPLLSIDMTGLPGATTLDLLNNFGPLDVSLANQVGADAPAGTIGPYLVDFTADTITFAAPAVPEPSTFLLLGAGLAGLGLWRRRKA